jgi:fatty-acyl-CoA synthase
MSEGLTVTYQQATATFADLLVSALKRWPERTAFEQDDRRFSYAEVASGVAKLSVLFGRPGSRGGRPNVGVLSINAVQAWMAAAAAQIAGGRFTSLPAHGSVADLTTYAADSEVTTLVLHHSLAEAGAAVAAAVPSISRVYSIGRSDLGPDLIELINTGPEVPLRVAPGIDPDEVCHVLYTGGTTGPAKGAAHTHRSVLGAFLSAQIALQLPHSARYLAAAPISHASWPFLAPVLYGGGTVVLLGGFDPEEFCRTVEQRNISLTVGVPTMIYALLDHAQGNGADLSSLQRFVYGASPISADRLAEAHQMFGQVFAQVYSTVECYGTGACLASAQHDLENPERLISCGMPMPGVSMAVLDQDGHELGDDEVGEIGIRTPAAMKEYWNNPAESALAFAHGWLHTGDLGRRDGAGYYTIIDRLKDVIVSGGFNVFASEVERVIASHPDVSAVAVIGVPDDKWGEAVKAIVVPVPGRLIIGEEIRRLVRAKKGPVSTPKSVDVIDKMPLTTALKVDKRTLRERYWNDTARQVH